MYKRWFGIAIIGVSILLVACESPDKNYEYFVTHPKSIKPELIRCQQLSGSAVHLDETCVAAFKAANRVNSLLRQAVLNPAKFGADLIAVQEKQGELRQQIIAAREQDNVNHAALGKAERELRRFQFDIQTLYAVLRIRSGL